MSASRINLDAILQRKDILFFDGAMGTMIQNKGMTSYSCPEELNLSDPELIFQIHRSYVEAGAQVIETNTFGVNRVKLKKVDLTHRQDDLISAGVELARRAAGDRALVAGSIGPLGEFLRPIGPVGEEEALEIFKEVTMKFKETGVDLLIIETMSDIKEVRVACLAAHSCSLPFIVSMTFEEEGRTVLGTPPQSAAITAQNLGALAVGMNCSAGPAGLLPILRQMSTVARCPIIIQPNAGLPVLEEGQTVFPIGPEEFATEMVQFLDAGARILGGCCGTTPEHIKALIFEIGERRPALIETLPGCHLSSRADFVLIGQPYPVVVIGERVNPTGRKQMAVELSEGNMNTIRKEIIGQVKAGADLLDINVGLPDIEEHEVLPEVISFAQKIIKAPLVIDTVDSLALEEALKVVDGRVLINSVNASSHSLETVLPLARRYGAAIIGLAMDERGIPESAAARLHLAEKIVQAAIDYGFEPSDILIDCLSFAAGSNQSQVRETLTALQILRESLGTQSVLGVSNVSHGLPAREELNSSFLSMAVYCGLDAAIINPYSNRVMDALASAMVLVGRDIGASSFIKRTKSHSAEAEPSASRAKTPKEEVFQALSEGDGEKLKDIVRDILNGGVDPLSVSQNYLIPALEKIGDLFEKKVFFLPQVISSAEAVRKTFAMLNELLPKSDNRQKEKILLASVEGDIHDLGKNILKSLLENYGYAVEDLGINVPPSKILERTKRGDIRLVGLSALMTTTLPAMEETVAILKKERQSIPVVVGGAVVTEIYAEKIKADGYAPDATQAVRLIRKLLESL